nr:immunoglobulin heavy chain junction region [Macaca mulatta]MOV38472.1 immunoglobulin heavy chain junction region [Macaca mulatta]MOV38694.1 immunoglobulin heavy chain junction region [Macaca mulatta]MOV38792.1 immunoglobulin heavy chain junction region [Macaca mulatta]MOV39531.1 immunoglobulin heavy chain junction region [Macaca mulatta]
CARAGVVSATRYSYYYFDYW